VIRRRLKAKYLSLYKRKYFLLHKRISEEALEE
jgi:hypothetical protein